MGIILVRMLKNKQLFYAVLKIKHAAQHHKKQILIVLNKVVIIINKSVHVKKRIIIKLK